MTSWHVQFIAPTPEAADRAAKAEFAKSSRFNPNHAVIHAAARILINQMPNVPGKFVRVECTGNIDSRSGQEYAKVELMVELVKVIDG